MAVPPALQPYHPKTAVGGHRVFQASHIKSMLAEQRRIAVAEQYLKCVPIAVIAKELNVVYRTVQNDLHIIRAEWRKRAGDDWLSMVAKESEKLDRVEKEAWEQWEKSKNRLVMKVKDSEKNGAATEKEWEQADPTFLKMVLDCTESRRKLFGLDAPKRVDVSGEIVHRGPLTRDEMQAKVMEIMKRSRRPAQAVRGIQAEENDAATIDGEATQHVDEEEVEGETFPLDDPWGEEGGEGEPLGGETPPPAAEAQETQESTSDDDWDL